MNNKNEITKFELLGNNISIFFKFRKYIFKNICFQLKNSEIIGITGHNGSGKTTLLKTICNIIQPSEGKITFQINSITIPKNDYNDYFAFVAPYLNLYEEFTAIELIELSARLRGSKYNSIYVESLLKRFDLHKKCNDYIKTFSSGMKQRLRFVLAICYHPSVILLDEPFTNLDDSGIEIVIELIKEKIYDNCGIIIAGNNMDEISQCSRTIHLGKQ